MIRLRVVVMLAFAVAGAVPAAALDETIEISSRAISDEEFLRGDDSRAAPVTITGRLTGPDSDAPVPVVILLHGSDGPKSGAAGSWRFNLLNAGVTTLRLDSYSARGLDNVSSALESTSQFIQIYDAFRAADVLAADPRVDASRIGVMGFSRGGTATLYAAMTRFREAFGPERATIVAYLPFYPACNFELARELEVADVPIRVFHGGADDWTPVGPCRDYVDRLAAAGADAALTEYPGARHGFDNLGNPALMVDSAWQTSRDCFRREEDGRLLNVATGAPFTYADACVAHGPSTQYDAAAAEASLKAVTAILTEVFAAAPPP